MSLIKPKWTECGIRKTVIKPESTNFTAECGIVHIVADGAGAVIATLPTHELNASLVIKSQSSSILVDTILVNTAGGGSLIDGEPTYSFSSDKQSITFVSDGTNWNII
jgi:hypothetical protein